MISRCNLSKSVIKKVTLLILVELLLFSCSSTPDANKEHSIFYPALPDQPRIQFLASFSGSNRHGVEKNSFADFVLGNKSAADNQTGIVKPYGVAFYNNLLYVVDTRLPGYVIVSLKDHIIKSVRGTGSGRFVKPINITIDVDGTKYITDTGKSKVLVYDKDDNYVRSFGTKSTMRPGDVLILNDRLYVSDLKNHSIHVLDKRTGGRFFTIGKVGSAANHFFYPTNMAKTLEGDIYVSDTGNFSVKKYSRSGSFIEQIGEIGTGLGHFARPKGVAVDHKGRLYVVDAAFENIQLFDRNNQVLVFFGGSGLKPGNVNLPTDVELDYDHVEIFQKYAKPGFNIEYLIFVTSQFGPFKVSVYGFGLLDMEKYKNETGDELIN
jgi:sugar lactone lactonase YvrE